MSGTGNSGDHFGSVPAFDFSGGAQPAPAVGAADGSTIVVDATSPSSGYQGIHPIAALFHVAFKAGALLTFILGNLFGLGYVLLLIITILLLAADFWTTKNVTGRILVALRWWNEVKEDGTSQWVFESSPEADQRVNPYDNWFFWVTTGGNCVAWLIMCVLNLFHPSTLILALAGFVLSGCNFLGFFKCRRDAKQRLTSFMVSQAAAHPETAGKVANFFG